MMAVARSAMPSLVKIVETLLATVLEARDRRSAMAGLERPAAIRSRIWGCRVVRSGNGSTVGSGAEKKGGTRRATPGPKMALPTATARIARAISSFLAHLTKHPLA